MKKLTIGQKLLISNLLYIVPIIALTYMMYQARSADIQFAEQEVIGVEYQAPLESLLEQVSLHRITHLRSLRGVAGAKEELHALQQGIQKALDEVKAVNSKYEVTLAFTDAELAKRKEDDFRYSKLVSKWSDLHAKLEKLGARESGEAHAGLIASIRGMISHLGNSSNLILDPDLDSYYLTDAILGGLPQLQDRMQEVSAFVEPLLLAGKWGADERTQFSIYSVLLQSDLDRVTSDVNTALNEDDNFHGRSESLQVALPPITKELSDQVGTWIAQLKELSKGGNISHEAFSRSAMAALGTSYRHWKIGALEDTTLLQSRIRTFESIRSNYVKIGFLVLLMAGLASLLVGRSLRKDILDSLRSAVSDLSRTSSSTSDTSAQIFTTSQKLSSAATQQSAALQETVSALTQINAMVGKSRDNALRSVEVVNNSQKAALEGRDAVDSMVRAISDIRSSNEDILTQTDASNKKIEEIVSLINEIETKTKVINDIVFQTKLLSFNASVEAARAGEQGKGFAVVAEEVGNLAQMSGNAAKEISEMLQSSTQKVASIVTENKSKVSSLISKGRSKVEAGNQTAASCKNALEQIVSQVEEATSRVNEIASAAEEQARGVEEITKAMQQLDQVTQSNSQMSHEASGFASDLNAQSANLKSIVDKIEREVLGGGGQVIQLPARAAKRHAA